MSTRKKSREISTVCGIQCTECHSFTEKECPGCAAVGGKPFWTAFVEIDECPVHSCCTKMKKYPHCGWCDELPCDRFTRFKDPQISIDEQDRIIGLMVEALRQRRLEEDK